MTLTYNKVTWKISALPDTPIVIGLIYDIIRYDFPSTNCKTVYRIFFKDLGILAYYIQICMLKGPVHYNKLTGLSLNELQTYEKSRIVTQTFAEKSDERDHRSLK